MHPTLPRVLAPASALSLAAVAWVTSPPQGNPEVEHRPVSGSVHVITGDGGNVSVSTGPEGTLLVDLKFLPQADGIYAALDELDGEGDGTPRLVVNTHYHGDHTAGNPRFGGRAPILAHANARARMAAAEDARPAGLPVLTYEEAPVLHLNGETVRLVHYPAAHTDGDTAVFYETSNVVHTGDVFFNGIFPYVDLEGGGSLAGTLAAARDVLARTGEDTPIIPGHGPLGSRADLEAYVAMLEETSALVREALAAGDDVDAMLANGLLDEYESWSWRFIDTRKFLTMLASELGPR